MMYECLTLNTWHDCHILPPMVVYIFNLGKVVFMLFVFI